MKYVYVTSEASEPGRVRDIKEKIIVSKKGNFDSAFVQLVFQYHN